MKLFIRCAAVFDLANRYLMEIAVRPLNVVAQPLNVAQEPLNVAAQPLNVAAKRPPLFDCLAPSGSCSGRFKIEGKAKSAFPLSLQRLSQLGATLRFTSVQLQALDARVISQLC